MQVLPKALAELIEGLGNLPGVGPRTAERYAYYLLKNDSGKSQKIAKQLTKLHEDVDYCPVTYALIEKGQSISPLYSDTSRDKQVIAVVAEPFDIVSLEKTASFHGTYHVLGGLISPIDGVNPEQLHIDSLVERVKKDRVKEIILALSASVEGESTALFLQKQLEDFNNLTVTRLARGLPVGVDLEYADHITLGRALEGRTSL